LSELRDLHEIKNATLGRGSLVRFLKDGPKKPIVGRCFSPPGSLGN